MPSDATRFQPFVSKGGFAGKGTGGNQGIYDDFIGGNDLELGTIRLPSKARLP